MKKNDTSSEEKKLLHDLVSTFDVAMLVTQSDSGSHARPMAIARMEDTMTVYLVADINSVKVDEIKLNPHALLTFQSTNKFASLQGQLVVSLDRTLIELLWKETWKVWFPKGKSDENIALLKFNGAEGEFWNSAGIQGLKYAYSATKAYLAGEKMGADNQQHSTVRL